MVKKTRSSFSSSPSSGDAGGVLATAAATTGVPRRIAALSIGFFVLVSAQAQAQAQAQAPYYEPGYATWLGGEPAWDDTPENYEDHFPIAYVVFGFAGLPHLRTIVKEGAGCPKALRRSTGIAFERVDGALYTIRAVGETVNNNEMPYKFPVQVCSIVADNISALRDALDQGDVVLSYEGKTYDVVPRVKRDPSRFLLTGDTGLRSKPSNLGLGKLGSDSSLDGGNNCTAPEVYGVAQCYVNFTPAEIDTGEQTGSFQGNDEWVFKNLADDASENDVDVIVYVGDYLYRQGPCPDNNTDSLTGLNKNCSGINDPPIANASSGVPPETVINFIPGYFGDNVSAAVQCPVLLCLLRSCLSL